MIAQNWAAAVAINCSIIIKPALETPLTTLTMGQLAQEASISKGVAKVLLSRRS